MTLTAVPGAVTDPLRHCELSHSRGARVRWALV